MLVAESHRRRRVSQTSHQLPHRRARRRRPGSGAPAKVVEVQTGDAARCTRRAIGPGTSYDAPLMRHGFVLIRPSSPAVLRIASETVGRGRLCRSRGIRGLVDEPRAPPLRRQRAERDVAEVGFEPLPPEDRVELGRARSKIAGCSSHRCAYAPNVSLANSDGRQSPALIEPSTGVSHAFASAASAKVSGAFRRVPSGARYDACHRPDGSFRVAANARRRSDVVSSYVA